MRLFLSILTVASVVTAQTCSWTDPTNGNLYNNLNIASSSTTDLTVSHNDWAFYLNLCTPVKHTECGTNSGVCQTWNGGSASLGSASTLAFSSLSGSCGVEHDNLDWPGNDLADPVPAASAAVCCTLCQAFTNPNANAYVYSPNTRNCWCKNVDLTIEPGPASDRVYGLIGSAYNSEDGVVATFTNGDAVGEGTRKTVIYMVCNRNAQRGSVRFLREGPQLYYYFIWTTAAACRSGTSGSATTTGVPAVTTTGTPSPLSRWAAGCNPIVSGNGNSMTFNLAGLEQSAKDYLAYDSIGHTYFLNFCRNTLVTSCGGSAAVCQKNEGGDSYLISTGQNVQYTFLTNYYKDRQGLEVHLTNGDNGRNATIELICSPSTSGTGRPQFIGEEPILNYIFVWYTQYACPTASVTTGVPIPSSTTAPAPVPVELYTTSFFDTETNTLYDLSSLMRAHEDWVAYDSDTRPYYINIGRSVITTECAGSSRAPSICQTWPFGGFAAVGAAHGATWSALHMNGKRGLRLNLTNGDDGRHAIINFYCGDPFSLGQPIFLNEDTTLEYHFEWTTSAACGKVASASCTKYAESDYGGYDSPLSPYQQIPSADACCTRCMALTSNAFAYQPSAKQCWCKTVPSGSIPYALTDRTYGTIGAQLSSTTGSSGSGNDKSSGLTGLETFLIIAVVFIVVGVAGGFGYVYWKRRQADQQPPNYLHLNLETAE